MATGYAGRDNDRSWNRTVNEWTRKGATLSDKTARAEFGLTQDEIIAAIRAGKLQYRRAEMEGNPWLRLLRREVEELVSTRHGERYLKEQQAQTGQGTRGKAGRAPFRTRRARLTTSPMSVGLLIPNERWYQLRDTRARHDQGKDQARWPAKGPASAASGCVCPGWPSVTCAVSITGNVGKPAWTGLACPADLARVRGARRGPRGRAFVPYTAYGRGLWWLIRACWWIRGIP
jgi:hypothetical protein